MALEDAETSPELVSLIDELTAECCARIEHPERFPMCDDEASE